MPVSRNTPMYHVYALICLYKTALVTFFSNANPGHHVTGVTRIFPRINPRKRGQYARIVRTQYIAWPLPINIFTCKPGSTYKFNTYDALRVCAHDGFLPQIGHGFRVESTSNSTPITFVIPLPSYGIKILRVSFEVVLQIPPRFPKNACINSWCTFHMKTMPKIQPWHGLK